MDCMTKYEVDIHVFVSLKSLFSFAVSLQKSLAHSLILRSNGETHRKKDFSSQKNDMYLPHFIIGHCHFFKEGQLKLRLQSL